MGTASDLDTLLEALDRAETAARALYRQLADNPDLAAEYDAGLRERQRKRLDLAQQVGVDVKDGRRQKVIRDGVDETPAPHLVSTASTLSCKAEIDNAD
jgi:hypothetical protein